LVVLLIEQAAMDMVRAGAVLSAGMAAGMAGRLVWGAAADRLGDARGVLIAIGVIAGACALLVTQITGAWPYAGVMLLAIVFGATTLGWNGVYIAELAREAPPGKVAMATGASLMFGYGGAVTVPPLCAWLRHVSGGYTLPFLLLAVFSAIGVASLLRRR
jgi:MFS family permease